MKSTCIDHPTKEPLIIIRAWQLEYCEGDRVAAALLSFFEYWHNIKLEMSARNHQYNQAGEEGEDLPTDLLQYHSEDNLIDGLVGVVKARKTLRRAIAWLEERGVIEIHKNPIKRFDNTRFFLFKPDVLNNWLARRDSPVDGGKIPYDKGKNPPTSTETTTENKERIKERDPLNDMLIEVSDATGPVPDDQWIKSGRDVIQIVERFTGTTLNQAERDLLVEVDLVTPDDYERWTRAARESVANDRRRHLVPVSRIIEVYQLGNGEWDRFTRAKWPNNKTDDRTDKKYYVDEDGRIWGV